MESSSVLVVEDHAKDAGACGAAFGALGCRVFVAVTAKKAFALLATRRFGLVCLSPGAPWTNEMLARLSPDQYAVALPSDPTMLPARFDAVLAKPISPLVAAVTVAMARTRQASAVEPGVAA